MTNKKGLSRTEREVESAPGMPIGLSPQGRVKTVRSSAVPLLTFPGAWGDTLLSIRNSEGKIDTLPLWQVSLDVLKTARPWRTPTFRHTQRNQGGYYWSVTNGALTSFESGNEHSFLMEADMDPEVSLIISQPFKIFANEAKGHSHVPDFLVFLNDDRVRIVEVKPRHRLDVESVSVALQWARQEIERHGWIYEVHTEMDPQEAENRRFLATYRRPWQFEPALLDRLRTETVLPASFAAIETRLGSPFTEFGPGTVRAHLLHLCWQGIFEIDLRKPLGPATTITLARRGSHG